MPRRKKIERRGKGEGSVYQRADGRWVGQIDLGRDPDTGRRRRPPFYGDTKEDVQKQIRTALYQAERGEYIEKTNYSVHEWVQKWLRQFAAVRMRPTTWAQCVVWYDRYWKRAVGSIPLQKLQATHIQAIVSAMQGHLAPSTIRAAIMGLRAAFTKAVELGLIGRHPYQGLELPQVPKKRRTIVLLDQVPQFLAAAKSERLYAFFVLALTSGLRPSEALGLHWSDLDLDVDEPCVRVERNLQHIRSAGKLGLTDNIFVGPPKSSNSRRAVPLVSFAVDALREHQGRMCAERQHRLSDGLPWPHPELVFTTALGTPMNSTKLSYWVFQRILKRAGLPHMDMYSLRRAFVTHMLEVGVDLKTTSEMAGHGDVSITGNVYAQVTHAAIRGARTKLDQVYRAMPLSDPPLDEKGAGRSVH